MTRHARLIGLLAAMLVLAVVPTALGSTADRAPAARDGASGELAFEPTRDTAGPAAECALKAWSDYALIDVIRSVAIDVLANDCLGAAGVDPPLRITAVTSGTYGTVSTDGRSVVYNPTGCTLGDGGWDTFGYTIGDGVATSSGVVGVRFRRPAAIPVTDVPRAGFVRGGTMGTTVPVRLSWCGVTASGTSIRAHRVIQSTNGGTGYATTPIMTGTSTSSTRGLAVNTPYRWQARTTDTRGRTGAYAPSLLTRITRHQEDSPAIRYSAGWTTASSTSYSGGKERYAQRAGATATLTVTNARQFAIVASLAPTRGRFHVYVDGVRRSTVSQRASTATWRRILYVGSLTSGEGVTHTIQVRSATSARIDIDAILTLSGKQDQAVSFSGPAPDGATYLGSAAVSVASGSSGLPVTLSVPPASWPVCSLDGGSVRFHGVGTCSVTATAASDPTWNGGTATWSVAVGPAPVTVTGITAHDRPYAPGVTTATLDLSAAALGGVAQADAAGVTLDTSGATGTFTDADAGTGKVVQVAGLALAGARAILYTVAQPSTTASITKADQVVAFTSAEPSGAVVGGSYDPTASATSTLAVSYSIDPSAAAVCSLAGTTVQFDAAGTCIVSADQAGNGNWNPAPQVQQAFTIAPAQGPSPPGP